MATRCVAATGDTGEVPRKTPHFLAEVQLFAIGLFPGHTGRPVQAVFDLLCVRPAHVVVVGVRPRHAATRWWGAVLVMPLAVVAGWVVNVFHGL